MSPKLVDSKNKIINSISRIVNALNLIDNHLQVHDEEIQIINDKLERQNAINYDIYRKIKKYELSTQVIYDEHNHKTTDYILYLDEE